MDETSEFYLEKAREYEKKAAEASDQRLKLAYSELARGYRAFL